MSKTPAIAGVLLANVESRVRVVTNLGEGKSVLQIQPVNAKRHHEAEMMIKGYDLRKVFFRHCADPNVINRNHRPGLAKRILELAEEFRRTQSRLNEPNIRLRKKGLEDLFVGLIAIAAAETRLEFANNERNISTDEAFLIAEATALSPPKYAEMAFVSSATSIISSRPH